MKRLLPDRDRRSGSSEPKYPQKFNYHENIGELAAPVAMASKGFSLDDMFGNSDDETDKKKKRPTEKKLIRRDQNEDFFSIVESQYRKEAEEAEVLREVESVFQEVVEVTHPYDAYKEITFYSESPFSWIQNKTNGDSPLISIPNISDLFGTSFESYQHRKLHAQQAMNAKIKSVLEYYQFIGIHSDPKAELDRSDNETALSVCFQTYWSLWRQFLINKDGYFYLKHGSSCYLFHHDAEYLKELVQKSQKNSNFNRLPEYKKIFDRVLSDQKGQEVKSFALISLLPGSVNVLRDARKFGVNIVDMLHDEIATAGASATTGNTPNRVGAFVPTFGSGSRGKGDEIQPTRHFVVGKTTLALFSFLLNVALKTHSSTYQIFSSFPFENSTLTASTVNLVNIRFSKTSKCSGTEVSQTNIATECRKFHTEWSKGLQSIPDLNLINKAHQSLKPYPHLNSTRGDNLPQATPSIAEGRFPTLLSSLRPPLLAQAADPISASQWDSRPPQQNAHCLQVRGFISGLQAKQLTAILVATQGVLKIAVQPRYLMDFSTLPEDEEEV